MDATWIEVAGLTIRAPVTAGTNLLLTGQCLLYYRSLRSSRAPAATLWGAFFLLMSFATLAGVVKHGFRHQLTENQLILVLWMSNLGSGVSTYFAQRATARIHAGKRWGVAIERLVALQLLVFVSMNVVVGPEIMLVIANSALGLIPVIVVEETAARPGHTTGVWIARGLSLSMLTGAVYVVGFSFGPWFNHIDVAHVLMGGSFYLILRGVR